MECAHACRKETFLIGLTAEAKKGVARICFSALIGKIYVLVRYIKLMQIVFTKIRFKLMFQNAKSLYKNKTTSSSPVTLLRRLSASSVLFFSSLEE
jgi:hypothetical protein